MARYLLSVYQPDGPKPQPEVLGRIMTGVEALTSDMRAAGVWVFAAGLHPAGTSTVLRARDGAVLMTDGPFTEGKEHLGGFTVIDAPDLDAALQWGSRMAEVMFHAVRADLLRRLGRTAEAMAEYEAAAARTGNPAEQSLLRRIRERLGDHPIGGPR
jgi:hypothetical protein